MKALKDLTGQAFGCLKVVDLASVKGKQGQRLWNCVCTCGEPRLVMQQSLTTGNTRTCGDRLRHPPNATTFVNGFVFMDVSTPTHSGVFTQIDAEDLAKVISIRQRWLYHDSAPGETWGKYVVASDRKTKLHRLIAGASGPWQTDHINGDTLDNRKSNLKIVTAAQNAKNQKRRKTNTSGHTGVYAAKGGFIAEIQADGVKHHLGLFETAYEASIAYRAAAKVLNFSDRHGL